MPSRLASRTSAVSRYWPVLNVYRNRAKSATRARAGARGRPTILCRLKSGAVRGTLTVRVCRRHPGSFLNLTLCKEFEEYCPALKNATAGHLSVGAWRC